MDTPPQDAHTPPDRRHGRWSLTLQKVPILILLVTVLATAFVVHFSWQYTSHQNTVDMLHKLNARITSDIVHEINRLFGTASANATLVHQLFPEGIHDSTDVISQEKLFLTTLQSNPTLSWVTVGFPNGDFFGTQRQGPNTFRSVTRRWNPKTQQATSTNRFFQQNGTTLTFTHTTVNTVRYFAPERAWYQAALHAEGPVWTDVYIYASSQKPGIDVAIPLKKEGRLMGVVAIGMALDQISEYLSQIAVGKTGTSFIINTRSELIAYPDISEVVVTKKVGEKLQLGHLSSARDSLLSLAAQATAPWDLTRINTIRRHTLTTNGMEYIVTLAPSGHDDWLTGTIMPTQEWVEDVNAIQNKLWFVIGAAILILSLFTFVWTRAFLVRPLLAISELATRIGQDKAWQETIPPASPIAEIDQLTRAMRRMGRDLSTLRTQALQQSETKLKREKSFTKLNREMRQAEDVASLCTVGLHFLMHEFETHIGAFYLLEEDDQLRLHAGYGLPPDHRLPTRFSSKEGWLGTVIREKCTKMLDHIPPEGFIIHTGTLDIVPSTIAAVPLIQTEHPQGHEPVQGVVVIGSIRPLSNAHLKLARRASSAIGIAITGIQSAHQKRVLLEQVTQQKEALVHSQAQLNSTVEILKPTFRTPGSTF